MKYIFGFFLVLTALSAKAQMQNFSLLPKTEHSLFQDTTSPQYPAMQTLISPIPSAYCYEELAIFCKLEVQLEKKFKFPVKIRLGEVNYVDMLEGKPHTPLQY